MTSSRDNLRIVDAPLHSEIRNSYPSVSIDKMAALSLVPPNTHLWLLRLIPRAALDSVRGRRWNRPDVATLSRAPVAPFRRGVGFYGDDEDRPICLWGSFE